MLSKVKSWASRWLSWLSIPPRWPDLTPASYLIDEDDLEWESPSAKPTQGGSGTLPPPPLSGGLAATPEARSVAEDDDDLATFGAAWPPVPPIQCSNITVHFSPNGQCTDAICEAIRDAESCVTVHAYVLTSLAIAEALIAARGRGVVVDVILDKRETASRHSKYRMLADGGVTVYLDAEHRISHNKVVLVDGWKAITGSFNLSAGAEANAENMLIIRSSAVVNAYMDNWKMHRAHCEMVRK